MIPDEDAKSLQAKVQVLKGLVGVGIGAGELIIYTSNTKHDFPTTWKGHKVRVVKTTAPRPATA